MAKKKKTFLVTLEKRDTVHLSAQFRVEALDEAGARAEAPGAARNVMWDEIDRDRGEPMVASVERE